MSKFALLPLALVALAGPMLAQTPAPGAKPMTEADLLKTLESLGKSDPIKQQPLSLEPLGQGAPSLSSNRTAALPQIPVALPAEKATAAEPKAPENPPPPLPAKGANDTEITAKEATFDQRIHQAVFLQDVVVINPQFKLTSEKLTAYLKHDAPGAAAGKGGAAAPAGTPGAKPAVKAAATPPPKTAATPAGTKAGGPAAGTKGGKKGTDSGGGPDKAGGLEKAIAEINVVITQEKVDAQGNVTVNTGHAKRAVYEAASGDITLTGRPDVSQGINTCVATDESTVMVLNRDGHMKVFGPHRVLIKDSADTAANGR